MFVADVAVTLGYVFFLTFANPLIVGAIVDLVSEGDVAPNEVLPTFGPYIIALVAVNVAGQVCRTTPAPAWRYMRAMSWAARHSTLSPTSR